MEQFSYNVTDAKDCVAAKDNHSEPNCTKITNGSFTGLGSGATYSDVVEDLFTGNLWPRYVSSSGSGFMAVVIAFRIVKSTILL